MRDCAVNDTEPHKFEGMVNAASLINSSTLVSDDEENGSVPDKLKKDVSLYYKIKNYDAMHLSISD